ncbi:MAG: PDZ domain-containing protein [Myxococcota bacterium]|nr:PDZ domain-containing protein [Myxococcota bacterium]
MTSCERTPIPPLASISELAPKHVEPGDVIRITGQGFVEGPALITLSGAFHPEGRGEVTPASVSLPGNAISSTAVDVPITDKSLGGVIQEPVRFRGSIEVAFQSARPHRQVRVIAQSDAVELHLRPAGGSILLAAKRMRLGMGFLGAMGIVPADTDSQSGLIVADVSTGSAAESAGITFGDRLLAVDGTAIAEIADLASIKPAPHHRFEAVSRNGLLRTITITAPGASHLDRDEFFAIVLSSVALGLFLAIAAPTRGWFARPAAATANPMAVIFGFAMVSIPLLLIPAVAILYRVGYRGSILLLSVNVLGLAITALFQVRPTPFRLALNAVHALPVLAVMMVATACGAAVGLSDIATSQQHAVWGWHAWSSPFALAATIGAMALLWPPRNASGTKRRSVSNAVNWMTAVPAAAMLTTCCLGGWLIPGVPAGQLTESGWLLASACLVFFVKTWMVLLIARWFASVGLVERRARTVAPRVGWRSALLCLATLSTLGWMWTDIRPAYRMAGQMLAIAACGTFFTVLAITTLKNARQSFG